MLTGMNTLFKENLVLLQLGMAESAHIEKNWIPGHPDRTVPDQNEWTKHMWGNHMADAAAAEEWVEGDSGTSRDHVTISVREVLQAMATEPM